MSSDYQKMKDDLASTTKELSESTSRISEQEYDLQKANHQVEKLIKKISELQKNKTSSVTTPTGEAKVANEGAAEDEIELSNELAKNRLIELEALQKANVLLAAEYEKLKQQLLETPEEVIVNSTKYKMLQTQYNLLFNEATVIRKSCEDARKLIMNNRHLHIEQVEKMEEENLKMRTRVRAEVRKLEKQLADCRKDLELVRIEYEHNMKAHEQVAPMAKEMRELVNSLRVSNIKCLFVGCCYRKNVLLRMLFEIRRLETKLIHHLTC
jgi:chromosome segregation ATPase